MLFETAIAGQIIRMFREQSALGQEPISWAIVTLGIGGWIVYYHRIIPDHKFPKYAACVGCAANFLGLLTVCYFRYVQ